LQDPGRTDNVSHRHDAGRKPSCRFCCRVRMVCDCVLNLLNLISTLCAPVAHVLTAPVARTCADYSVGGGRMVGEGGQGHTVRIYCRQNASPTSTSVAYVVIPSPYRSAQQSPAHLCPHPPSTSKPRAGMFTTGAGRRWQGATIRRWGHGGKGRAGGVGLRMDGIESWHDKQMLNVELHVVDSMGRVNSEDWNRFVGGVREREPCASERGWQNRTCSVFKTEFLVCEMCNCMQVLVHLYLCPCLSLCVCVCLLCLCLCLCLCLRLCLCPVSATFSL